MILCQAHGIFIWLAFLSLQCIWMNYSLQNEDLTTTLTVLKHDPNHLPFGENVTLICKTNLLYSDIWWTVNDKNTTEEEGYFQEKESENLNEKSGKR